MKRCIEFWIKVMSMDEERLMKVVMLEALEMGVKVKMGTEFGGKFEDVWMGWNESEALGGLSMGEVKKVVMEVAWREVRGVWRQEAERHPKFHLISRLMEKECEGSGMMVKSEMRMRRVVKLRGGTVELAVETGRWRGLRREESMQEL